MTIALDYAENTGTHTRVGLYDSAPATDPVPDRVATTTDEELEAIARDLVSGLGPCWDVNRRDDGYRMELSFERDL